MNFAIVSPSTFTLTISNRNNDKKWNHSDIQTVCLLASGLSRSHVTQFAMISVLTLGVVGREFAEDEIVNKCVYGHHSLIGETN